jgi:hypothetical protein
MRKRKRSRVLIGDFKKGSPAVGIGAAFNSQDTGTSRWQLRIEGYTNCAFIRKRAVATACDAVDGSSTGT